MSDKVFSKVRKTIDTIRRTSKSSKNVFEFFTILLRDSACSEYENNMADGDEVDEVFEITDFTTSSEWERFAARLEQLLIEWKLDGTNKKKSTSKGKELFNNFEKSKLNPIPHKKVEVDEREGSWGVISERISFGNANFIVSYHHLRTRKKSHGKKSKQTEDLEDCLPHAMMEMFDMEFDFPPRAHCLSRWYGLKEFVVISPAEDAEAVITESKCQLLLSSIGIAATNSKCAVPIFAHILQQWRRIYHGLCIGGGFRTTFHMSQLRHIPSQYGHLAGLLDIFKDKLACPISPMPPVTLTVRFTYVLNEWADYSWPQEPPDPSSCLECKVGVSNLKTLPFGACQDPLRELHLSTTWPCLSEEVIVDNSVYSDLDPCHAPQWSLRAKMSENPQCLLGEYLRGYMTLCHRQESTMQLLKNTLMDDDHNLADITHALQRLTEAPPVASLSSAVSRATSRISAIGDGSLDEYPIPGKLLSEILQHLFPDADQDLEDLEAVQQELLFAKMESENDAKEENIQQDKFRSLKSAPEDSLTFFLAVGICIVYHSYGGLKAVAHLWQEFVLEMRFRWENDIFIPRLKLQAPNLGSCLLHQKLQMLNCCIERKRLSKIRTASLQFSTNINKNSGRRIPNNTSNMESSGKSDSNTRLESTGSQSSISDDEEFFEALENQDESEKGTRNYFENFNIEGKTNSDSDIENSNDNNASMYKREGGKELFGDLKLLVSGEPLVVPITQEPAPMTEDMLEEQAEILTQLGTSVEGARVRAQMQSASLLSDMEAFKAANPGCLLEDFVRWYSPFDWILGPETQEEIEELERLKNNAEKASEEPSTPVAATVSEASFGEGWDTEEIEIADEDLVSKDAKSLMNEAKAGNLDQLQAPAKWREEGHLSLRMRIPGNMWVEVWQSARPVPVRRQKRLFDETKEAEKVLHFLAGMKPAEVAFQLFPVLLRAAVLRIEEAGARDIPAVAFLLDKVLDKASKLSWEMPQDLTQCEEFVKQLQLCELVVARANSLRYKFQDALLKGTETDKDVEHFLSALMEKPEVTVIGAGRGPAGRVLHSLFVKQESARMQFGGDESPFPNQQRHSATLPQDFPSPTGREYILRTTIPKPRPSSRPCPQRMYCVLTNDEFRLAGAFTDDVIFQ
ncbi:rab3 GTPase-activating protein catalytic subunit-like isoform X2 [Acropora palmata]|uniref:rab3 GTPase-activating protein catalytic subunit-like isoform X2 n=1 Tax=Acropora palmata TaxID=6131 RepID=UPI003DA03776